MVALKYRFKDETDEISRSKLFNSYLDSKEWIDQNDAIPHSISYVVVNNGFYEKMNILKQSQDDTLVYFEKAA